MLGYIYILIDPRDYKVRYVGQTIDPKRRYGEHCSRTKGNKHLSNWSRKLRSLKFNPIMKIVDVVDVIELDWYEIWWITYGKLCEWDLINDSAGGRGARNHTVTKETKDLIREKLKGNKNSLGCIRSDETKQKIRKTLMGGKHSEERKLNISNKRRGKYTGSFNKASVLNEEQVKLIDYLLRMGVTGKDLSTMFDVRETTISAINKGVNWGRLTGRGHTE